MALHLPNFLRRPEQKASRTGASSALHRGLRPWTPRDYLALAREGFARNAVAYLAVRLVAEAIANLPFVLYDGRWRRVRASPVEHQLRARQRVLDPRDRDRAGKDRRGGDVGLEAIMGLRLGFRTLARRFR